MENKELLNLTEEVTEEVITTAKRSKFLPVALGAAAVGAAAFGTRLLIKKIKAKKEAQAEETEAIVE